LARFTDSACASALSAHGRRRSQTDAATAPARLVPGGSSHCRMFRQPFPSDNYDGYNPGVLTVRSLKVDPAGLRVEAAQSAGRAAELSAVTPPLNPAVSTWQSAAGRSNRYRAATAKALTAGSTRQRCTADGLTHTAEGFESNDAVSAARLRAVGESERL
jgi:hypothetical protein